MSVFSNNLLLGAGGQSTGPVFDPTLIGNSVWLDGSADFLKRDNFALSADGRKEFIFSIWVQRNEFGRAQTQFDIYPTGSTSYNDGSRFIFQAGDQLQFSVGGGGSSGGQKVSSAKYRDISWYHVLISYNTNTSVTAASRHRLFVNGLEITDIGTYTAPPNNQSCLGSGTGNADLRIGRTEHPGIPYPPKAYYAQACYLEGKSFQAGDYAITDFLDSFTFGTNGSQFVPKADADIAALASTVGGASFCLDFADSADLGNDISSNANDFTTTSMAAVNQSTNTPSHTYAVMDVLKNDGANTSTMVFSEGNTRVTGTGGSDGGAFSTLPLVTTGTTEFQATFNNGDGVVGICCYDNLLAVSSSASRNVTGGLGVNYNAAYGYQENGEKVVQLSSGVTRSAQGAALTTNSVVTVRYDADSNEITFLKDNVVQGSAVSTVAGLTYYAFVARFNNYDITLHFDSADFPHTIGSGNKTINTANLTAPEYQGIDYFKPVLYTGNGTAIGSGGKAVTGVGWKPDEVWIKNRDATDDHALYDIVRGVTKQLESNTATAESTESEGLTTFGSDGFTVGSLAQVNTNTEDYVSWNWLGSNSTSTTSPAGTIASTSSVARAGHFSVGTYTGQTAAGTVGHGLGGVAEMVIVWDKGFANSIAVYHYGVASDAATDYLLLNQTDAATDNATFWNDTTPTSSVFSVGTGNNTNGNTRPKSFLAFRSVPGVCKVGSYTGNGSATAPPYVSVGFKPSWVMIKNAAAAKDWVIVDTARTPINTAEKFLFPNLNIAEAARGTASGSDYDIDVLADGFLPYTADSAINGNGNTFVYLAMADIGGNGTLPPVYGR